MSRVRSQYDIERSALAQASARHAAVAARVERSARTYKAQGLDAARGVPKITSIAGMTSSQVRAEVSRLESAMATADRSATSELDGRCRSAYESAFAAAKAKIDTDTPEAILGDERLERRPRGSVRSVSDQAVPERVGPQRAGPEQALVEAITTAKGTVERVIHRLAERAPAESRGRVVELASMITEATSPAQVERVVLAVRSAVAEANDLADAATQRDYRLDGWHERLHLLGSTEARDLEDRIRRLDPDTPWPGGLAEQIERELIVAERQDARQQAVAATRLALESLGYGVSAAFTEEAFGSEGSLAAIPKQNEHMVRVRERRGALLMDVVRVVGVPAADADLSAEQVLCDSLDELAVQASRNGVTLVMKSEPASGDLDFVERETPTGAPVERSDPGLDRGPGAKRARSRRGAADRAQERRS